MVHHAAPGRSAAVAGEVMAGHRPAMWLSDRDSAQQGHGERQQACRVHLAGDVALSDRKALRLSRRLTALAASTLARERRELEQRWTGNRCWSGARHPERTGHEVQPDPRHDFGSLRGIFAKDPFQAPPTRIVSDVHVFRIAGI